MSDSTLTGNSATVGGGIDQAGTLTLLSTIVAGNTAPTGPDIDGTVAAGTNNLIGSGSGLSGLTNNTSSNQVGANASLTVLGNYGGPIQTIALLPGSLAGNAGGALTSVSAAIAAGDTTITVAAAAAIASTPGSYVIQIDQEQMLVTNVNLATNVLTVERGYDGTTATGHSTGAGVFLADDERGKPRVVSGKTDVGAFFGTVNTTQTAPPTATLQATAVSPSTAATGGAYTFSIAYQSSTYVDASAVAASTVLVQPPYAGLPIGDEPTTNDIGATLAGTVLSGNVDGLGDGQTITATYQFTPPGGSWATAPNGLYTVALGGSVTDTNNNAIAASTDVYGVSIAPQLGGFQVATSLQPPLSLLSMPNPSEAGATSGIVSGLGLAGASISVTATDGTNTTQAYTTTVGVDGSWTIGNVDVSSLSDGTLTYTAAMTTAAGTQTSTLTATKDTAGTPASMTYYVPPGFGTLQAAINEAEASDVALNTLMLSAGKYDLSDVFAQSVPILVKDDSGLPIKTIVIVGQGLNSTFIEPGTGGDSAPSWNSRIVQVNAGESLDVAFDDLTIKGGNLKPAAGNQPSPAQGGGILIYGGDVTLSNAAVTSNKVYGASGIDGGKGATGAAGAGAQGGELAQGGGIYLASGTLNIVASSISGNAAVGGTGGGGGAGGKAANRAPGRRARTAVPVRTAVPAWPAAMACPAAPAARAAMAPWAAPAAMAVKAARPTAAAFMSLAAPSLCSAASSAAISHRAALAAAAAPAPLAAPAAPAVSAAPAARADTAAPAKIIAPGEAMAAPAATALIGARRRRRQWRLRPGRRPRRHRRSRRRRRNLPSLRLRHRQVHPLRKQPRYRWRRRRRRRRRQGRQRRTRLLRRQRRCCRHRRQRRLRFASRRQRRQCRPRRPRRHRRRRRPRCQRCPRRRRRCGRRCQGRRILRQRRQVDLDCL